MDFHDSEEHAEFRARVRAWIDERRPFDTDWTGDHDAALEEWHRALHEAGFVGLSLPTDVGGQGLDIFYETILLDELGAAGAPPVWRRGYLARTLDRFGNEQQRQRFVAKALAGEEKWCQGFSEPDAGSDLASVRTRAVVDGDGFRITGQKIWTSEGHLADWCLLLARTDPEAKKHAGLTCFLVDLRTTDGVEVRPFRQLTGEYYFSELFFEDAFVPAENILGDLNGGWAVASAILALERGPADIGFLSDFRRTVQESLRQFNDTPDILTPDVELEFGRAAAFVELLRLRALESLANREGSSWRSAESSVDKLLMAATDQALGRALLDLHSVEAALDRDSLGANRYLWSRAATIRGGTAEVQRSVIATRLLDLPR